MQSYAKAYPVDLTKLVSVPSPMVVAVFPALKLLIRLAIEP